MNIILLIIPTCLQFFLAASSEVPAFIEKLNNATRHYDKRVRPFSDVAPVNISIQLVVIGLGPIDEKSLTLGIDFYLRMWWQDERLNIGDDVFNYNGDPSQTLWVPDVFITNSVKSKSHQTLVPNNRITIGPRGKLYISSRITTRTVCRMNLRRYPFDHQKCEVHLESYSYNHKEVVIQWKNASKPAEYLKGSVQLSGYKLVDITGQSLLNTFKSGETFAALLVNIHVQRTYVYYLNVGYVPCALLVVLTWSTFWISPKAVPARVAPIVTNFLATIFVFQQQLQDIVKVDYATTIEIFVIANLLFVGLAMVEYLIVLNYPRERKKRRYSFSGSVCHPTSGSSEVISGRKYNLEQQRRGTGFKFGQNANEIDDVEETHPVDYYSRSLVPLLYLIFLVTYALYCAFY